VDFSGTNLLNVVFQSSDLHGATFTGANLTGARLTKYPQLAGVNLEGTQLAGAVLTGVQSGGLTGTPASLPSGWSVTAGFLLGPGADINSANFSGLDLHGRNLSGTQLSFTDLSGANLQGASLANAVVRSSNLRNSQLGGTDLTGGSFLQNQGFAPVDLTGATGTPIYAGAANFTGVICPDGTAASAHGDTCQGHPWP
jgi:uncharacterized protein YjbI with pentapeptide repeats